MNDCILTKWSKDNWGYGYKTLSGKKWMAHRYTWSQVNGPIPDGFFICHTCDNPSCINISHLFLGRHSDNMRDMYAKGRHKGGANHAPRVNKLEYEKYLSALTYLKKG